MERIATVLLLFALTTPADVPEGTAPSALVLQGLTEQPRHMEPEMLIGAWRGSHGSNGELLEVIFANDIRTATVVAHFTFIDAGASKTVRRFGRLMGGEVRFALVGGGQIVLTFAGENRLLGGSVQGSGQGSPLEIGTSMELSRLRPQMRPSGTGR